MLVGEAVTDGEIIETTEVDSDPVRVAPSPYTQTQQEVDDHNVDHIPRAAGVSTAHMFLGVRTPILETRRQGRRCL